MSRYAKVRANILSGKSDKNISEEDMKFFFQKSVRSIEEQRALILNTLLTIYQN